MTLQAPSNSKSEQDIPETSLETSVPNTTSIENAPVEENRREVAQLADPNSFVNQAPTDPSSPQVKQEQEVKKTETQAYVDGLAPATKMKLNNVGIAASMLEDIYNTSADMVNFATQKGLGYDLLPNIKAVEDYLPTDNVSVTYREVGKFIAGYSGIMSGMKAAKVGTKAASAVSGVLADFSMTDPDSSSLLTSLIKKTSVGSEIVDYLNGDPKDQTNLEKRLRNSLMGVLEGALLEQFLGAIKLKKKIRDSAILSEEPPPVPVEAGKSANIEDVPVITREQLPPVVEPDILDESLVTPHSSQRYDAIKEKQILGEGSPNEFNKATPEGRAFLNITKFNADDDIRKLIYNEMDITPELYAKQTTTFEDMVRLADESGIELPADVINLPQERMADLGIWIASKRVELKAADAFRQFMLKEAAGEVPKEIAIKAYANFSAVTKKLRDISHVRALALAEGRVAVDLVSKGAGESAEIFAKRMQEARMYFGDDYDAMKQYLSRFPDTGAKEITKAMSSSSVNPVNFLTQIRMNGILSSPITHGRNVLSNMINIGVTTGENLTAATLNKIYYKDPLGVTFKDSLAGVEGMFQGFSEALTITGSKVKKAFGKGDGAEFLFQNAKGKISDLNAIKEPTTFLGRALNFLITAPGRALKFEDDFIKHINARMSLAEQASRQSRLQGAQSIDQAYHALKNNPTEDMLALAYKDASINTFTNDINGKYVNLFKDFAQTPLGKIVAPFANTNLNAMVYRLERIPVLNLVLDDYRAAIKSANPVIRQKAISKSLFVGTTMATAAYTLHSADAITGNRNKDYGKWRLYDSMGRPANSIKVGNSWIEYRRETPMGSILGMMADIADLRDADDGRDPDLVNDAAMTASIVAMQVFNPDFFTNGMTDLLTAIKDGNVESAKSLLAYSAKQATTIAPYSGLARSLSNQFKTNQSETFNPNSIWESTFASIKALYLPEEFSVPKRNILGDAIPVKEGLGPDFISPIGYAEESDDPVLQELARLAGVSDQFNMGKKQVIDGVELYDSENYLDIKMPSKTMSGSVKGISKEYRMNLKEYDELVQMSSGTHEIYKKAGMPSLKESLKKVFNDSSYKSAPMDIQMIKVQKVINKYKTKGKQLFMAKDNAALQRAILRGVYSDVYGL